MTTKNRCVELALTSPPEEEVPRLERLKSILDQIPGVGCDWDGEYFGIHIHDSAVLFEVSALIGVLEVSGLHFNPAGDY